MKLNFKHQPYQADSVQAIADCFQGQPKVSGFKYAVDPGREAANGLVALPGTEAEGFSNAGLVISPATVLTNLQEVQRRQILPVSPPTRRSITGSIVWMRWTPTTRSW